MEKQIYDEYSGKKKILKTNNKYYRETCIEGKPGDGFWHVK